MNYKYIPFLTLIFNACQPVNECKDIDYGATSFQPTTQSPWPYKNWEVLVFKDSLDHELKFIMDYLPSSTKGFGRFHDPMRTGDCAGEAEITGHLEAMSANFRTWSLPYKLECYYYVDHKIIDDKPIFYESMITKIYYDDDSTYWQLNFSHITNYRGNEPYLQNIPQFYVYEDHTTLNGKEFNQVYHTEDTLGGSLYFNHELGFIAFKQNGKPLWVLDRFE
jgi:hypothetical protein